jgi:two-component system OmpR family response regulator
VISSLSTVDDRILGLKAGGDDYLTKPFAMGELIARVEALLRRAKPERATTLSVGPLVVDLISRSVRRGDRDIVLLPREFSLLEYLMRHAGLSVTRAMLLEDVWNYRASTQTNVVDVHVGNLRRKIDADGEPRLIESVRGIGFRLRDGNDDDAS